MNALRYIPIISAILAFSIADAQKIKTYKAWVTLTNEKQVTGILYSANEDGIVLTDKHISDTLSRINPTSIQLIKIRRKGKVGRGILIGSISGMAAGAFIVWQDQKNRPHGMESFGAAAGGVVGLPVGAIAGVIIGSGSKKFEIDGHRGTYLFHLIELQGYALN